MVSTELNSEFEVLFEDLATQGSKGLDMYEKSLCFTYSQEKIVKSLATSNTLSPITALIKTDSVTATVPAMYKNGVEYVRKLDTFYDLSYFCSSADRDIPGKIVTPQVIDAMLLQAYQYPPINLVYVMVGENTNIVFPPLNFNKVSFSTRYVDYPPPVILENLTGTDTINGVTVETLPLLDDTFQRALVYEAVMFAISIYVGQPEKDASDDSKRNK